MKLSEEIRRAATYPGPGAAYSGIVREMFREWVDLAETLEQKLERDVPTPEEARTVIHAATGWRAYLGDDHQGIRKLRRIAGGQEG